MSLSTTTVMAFIMLFAVYCISYSHSKPVERVPGQSNRQPLKGTVCSLRGRPNSRPLFHELAAALTAAFAFTFAPAFAFAHTSTLTFTAAATAAPAFTIAHIIPLFIWIISVYAGLYHSVHPEGTGPQKIRALSSEYCRSKSSSS